MKKEEPIPLSFETRMLPIEEIKPSLTNPRKHFDEAGLKELESSIRTHGFTLSALIVRPRNNPHVIVEDAECGLFYVVELLPDGTHKSPATAVCKSHGEAQSHCLNVSVYYELVSGERRWRAAKAVGLSHVPVSMRTLTDSEVLELQLVENIQRMDLTVMEEAEGYQRLLALRNEANEPIYTIKKIAEKTGRSLDTISRRLTLMSLGGDARVAVESGVLPPRTALLIARIPNEAMRKKATKDILHPKYQEGPLSLRQATEVIWRDYIQDLRGAPFSQEDAGLLPLLINELGMRIEGGACVDCPFKAANLQGDEAVPKQQHNNCLNPPCYARKREVGWQEWMKSEAGPKRTPLKEEECEKIYTFGDQLNWSSGYVDLEDHPDGSDLKAGLESPGPWKSLTKGAELEVVVARDKFGKVHELVKRDLAIEAASTINDHKIFKKAQVAQGAGNDTDRAGENAKIQAENALKKRIKREQVSDLALAIQGSNTLPIGFWKLMGIGVIYLSFDEVVEVASRRGMEQGMDPNEWLCERLDSMSDSEVIALLVELLLVGQAPGKRTSTSHYSELEKKWLSSWSKLLEVDLKAVEKRVKAEIKLEEKAKAEAEKARAGKKLDWTIYKDDPASEDLIWQWNEHGVCLTPDMVELPFPKNSRCRGSVEVAPTGYAWVYGHHFNYRYGSNSGPVSINHTKYSSRELALKGGLLEVLEAAKSHEAPFEIIKQIEGWINGIEGESEKPAVNAKKKGVKK